MAGLSHIQYCKDALSPFFGGICGNISMILFIHICILLILSQFVERSALFSLYTVYTYM